MYREALKFRLNYLSPNHLEIGNTMNKLAGVLKSLNRL